jgi:hypothetical protein
MRRALAVIVALGASRAAADPELRITHEPPPTHLRMRPRARRTLAAATPAPSPSPAPDPAPPAVPTAAGADLDAAYVRDVREPISVRFSLGYQVDGSTLTGQPTLGGHVPRDAVHSNRPDIDLIHAFGFGDAYLSTRGVGVPSLSTYFASHFQVSQQKLVHDPGNPLADAAGNVVTPPPIATWFDRSGVTSTNVWAEVKDFLPWHELAPLRVRAGEQYVYGPWVLHMYGVLAAWEGKLFQGTVYAGSRVPDYTLGVSEQQLDRSLIGGGSVRVDLRDLRQPIPFTASVETTSFTRVGAGENKPSNDALFQLEWRPRDDFALIGQARTIDGEWANEHVQFRARYHQVTNVVFDLTHRHDTDWRWDPSLVGPESTDPLAPKRYLELGPVVPQLLVSARAGTLIAENVDLYGRVAASNDLRTNLATDSSFAASYVEGGGALEVRLRRTIAVGISGLVRRIKRADDLANRIPDVPGFADPLPAQASIGERGFVEGGATMRMNLGARRFSALVEIYTRNTDFARDYCVDTKCMSDADTGVRTSELRTGGRFTVEGWIGKRVRLYASYDLSTGTPLAPELTGYKSLRLIMEGVY